MRPDALMVDSKGKIGSTPPSRSPSLRSGVRGGGMYREVGNLKLGGRDGPPLVVAVLCVGRNPSGMQGVIVHFSPFPSPPSLSPSSSIPPHIFLLNKDSLLVKKNRNAISRNLEGEQICTISKQHFKKPLFRLGCVNSFDQSITSILRRRAKSSQPICEQIVRPVLYTEPRNTE